MSLLRSVLKKKADSGSNPAASPFDPTPAAKKSSKNPSSSAASFRSVATAVGSIKSFYTFATGQPKTQKRRRPDILTFGAPKFCNLSNPPPPEPVDGTERVPIAETSGRPYTSAHGYSVRPKLPTDPPRLSIVFFSHAKPADKQPLYYDRACIAGEIRLAVTDPLPLESIIISFVATAVSDLEVMQKPMISQRIILWTTKHGDPTQAQVRGPDSAKQSGAYKKPWAVGTYVFPFSFQPLRPDVQVRQQEEVERKNKGDTRVDLPPNYVVGTGGLTIVRGMSAKVQYKMRVDVEYGAPKLGRLQPVPDFIQNEISYLPRTRPLLRELPPFPLLPTREDWPFTRETIGGWSLTPFGGRGRFDGRMVDVEGILGVPYPPTYGPQEKVPYTLILWSTDVQALDALSQPSSVSAMFCSNEVYGKDALVPRTEARRSRKTKMISEGSVVRVSGGLPSGSASGSSVSSSTSSSSSSSSSKPASRLPESRKASPLAASSLRDSVIPEDSELTLTSPTPGKDLAVEDSTEDDAGPEPDLDAADSYPGAEEQQTIATLRGEVSLEGAKGFPSFNYKYFNRNYMLKVVITHPKYSHISPSALGIYSEAPLWITSDDPLVPARPSNTDTGLADGTSTTLNPQIASEQYRRLPVIGRAVSIPTAADSPLYIQPHVWAEARQSKRSIKDHPDPPRGVTPAHDSDSRVSANDAWM